MNFLAHAVLSFEEDSVLTGNMISDFVKGKKKFNFPIPIQEGIMLHRMIDAFTDTHPATQEAKSFFRHAYRLYSGPIVDIVYDHFLANDVKEFRDAMALETFAKTTYSALEKNSEYWPPVFATIFPYMKSENWLLGYRMVTGIQKSLRGLARRSLYMPSTEEAYRLFNEHYSSLQYCYEHFFPEVKQYALQSLSNLKGE